MAPAVAECRRHEHHAAHPSLYVPDLRRAGQVVYLSAWLKPSAHDTHLDPCHAGVFSLPSTVATIEGATIS
jgi:hypothetical protein